jgi:hypothetical protein
MTVYRYCLLPDAVEIYRPDNTFIGYVRGESAKCLMALLEAAHSRQVESGLIASYAQRFEFDPDLDY